MIPESTLNSLRTAAIQFPTTECCGLLTTDYQLFPVKNVSKTPQRSFIFDKKQYFSTLKEIKAKQLEVLAVYHTHPSGDATPSKADLESAESLKMNSLIVSCNDWKYVTYDHISQ